MKIVSESAIHLILFLALNMVVQAADDWPPQVHIPDSSYAGNPNGIEIVGDRVYVSTQKTIAAFDISDPNAILYLGSALTVGNTQRFFAEAELGFTVDYHGGFNTYDLSKIGRTPPKLGNYPVSSSTS